MAQVTDFNIGANPSGFDMRTELNNMVGAITTDNSGSSEPLSPFAFMKWIDTSNATYYYIKERNHTNDAWVSLWRYTVATKVIEPLSWGNPVTFDLANAIHIATTKATPVDADELALSDSAATFGLKKLTWANLKATLATYFNTLYMALTGNQTIAGIKTFSSSPIVPNATTATQAIAFGQSVNLTAAQTVAGIKTFSSSPIVPTPTTSTQVASKGYADSIAGISLSTANSYDLGVGQTWQDVTGSRVSGTTYTNSTGKPIYIMVGSSAGAGNTGTITVGGVVVLSIVEGGDSNQSFGCIVPNGVVYVVSMAAIGKWVELR